MSPPKCTVRSKANATECATCRSAAYCSPHCRKEDDRLHSMICEQFTNFKSTNPLPSDMAFLIIRLLPESTTLKLVWLQGSDESDMKVVQKGKKYNKPIFHDLSW